jgi:predicted MFS family arabinose efflux permease
VPESRVERTSGQLDVIGAVTITAALAAGVYAITRFDVSGGIAGSFLVSIAASAVLIGLFWFTERHVAEPLLQPALLGVRRLWGASAGVAANTAAYSAAVFIGTLYLQDAGYGATAIGMFFLPLAVGAFASPLFGRLLTRVDAHLVACTGLLVVAIALATFARLAQLGSANPYVVALTLLLFGLGQYAAWVALVGQATSDVERSQYGAASGIFKTSTHVGAAVAVAVSATVIDSVATRSSVDGYALAYLSAAVLTALGAVAAVCMLRSPQREAAPRSSSRA